MRYSDYNIFSKIRDSENYFILNLLTGNADILSPGEASEVEELKKGKPVSDSNFFKEFIEKGYISDEASEKGLYRSKYLDFVDSREDDEIQLFYVPDYSCNFVCEYCYQDQYSNSPSSNEKEVADAFFSYISATFAGKRKYITIFGGEPLLPSPARKLFIEYFLERAQEAGIDVSIVTNGYALEDYIPLLSKYRIREIQVTLDGTAEVHNKRRYLKGGGATFDRIVNGIDAALNAGMEINLRMVIDAHNIENLPEMARFAISKGWTKSKSFKTQFGRNYELHHCQVSSGRLFDRLSMYETIYEQVREFPEILEFHKPAYSVAKFLAENGELPDPLFDSCPACKTEWAFDYSGSIYSCTATVGKSGEVLGTFYPVISLNKELVEEWQERDVTSINECKNCNLQHACGGGCGSVAKNMSGKVCSPDCRPITGLLEIGFSAYLEN